MGYLIKRASTVGLFSILFLSILSCSGNILETFGDKDTDQAKYTEALMLINKSQYDDAITVLLSMSAEYQAKREVKALAASAYAGRGGLTFLTLIEAFQNPGGVRLYPFLVQGFIGATAAKSTDLNTAAGVIDSISTDPASRTADENVFAALIYLGEAGSVLNTYLDNDNNGTLDGTFVDACVDADNPGTSIDDANVGVYGMAILNFLKVLPYIDNFASGVLTGLTSCADVEGLNALLTGICAIDDPANYTANHIAGFRSLIKEDNLVGMGVACTGDVSACNCPP